MPSNDRAKIAALTHGLIVAQEAINRLFEVARGEHSASVSEIADVINNAQSVIANSLLVAGHFDDLDDMDKDKQTMPSTQPFPEDIMP